MKIWQKVVCIIILILILILIVLIISNFTREQRMFNKIESIYLNNVSFQNISIPNNKLKEKSYSFKIINYKGNKLIDKNIVYTISISTSENLKVLLFKENNKIVLKDGISPKFILSGKDYTDDIFKIKIINKNITKDDFVNVKIKSWIKK